MANPVSGDVDLQMKDLAELRSFSLIYLRELRLQPLRKPLVTDNFAIDIVELGNRFLRQPLQQRVKLTDGNIDDARGFIRHDSLCFERVYMIAELVSAGPEICHKVFGQRVQHFALE